MNPSYRLIGRIEAGELAELYKAEQQPGGEVVIKLFHARTSDAGYAQVLADTSRVLNPLHHEGIVHFLDIGFVKDQLAVVRESVNGHALGSALQRLNTKEVLLPAPIALFLVIQLLDTVERAHAAGIVHGAITPGNVLISVEGKPSVCDFGALQALLAVPQLKRTFAGRGRSAYRAPELARGEPATVQSDVYSLGAIAYELLTLREAIVPGGGGVSTRRGGLPPPSRLDRRIHSRLDGVIMRSLDSYPGRRFRTCAEFSSALRNFLSAGGGMPGNEDLRRFVSELYPNEVQVGVLAPVPFSEPFSLTPISGVSITQFSAEELEASVVMRPSYSPSLSEMEAEAHAASPAVEDDASEFAAPEPTNYLEPPRPTFDPPPASSEPTHIGEPPGGSEPTRIGEPVGEGEGPSRAAPLEEWDAPTGVLEARPRKAVVSQGEAPPSGGTQVAHHPRVRMVEDYSAAPPREAGRASGPAQAAALPHDTLPTLPSAAAVERSHIPMASPASPKARVRKVMAANVMFTEERNLLQDARKRRWLLGVAVLIALVGLVSFVAATLSGPSAQPAVIEEDPRVAAIGGSVEESPVETPPRQPTAKSGESGGQGASESTAKKGAWLSISTNMSARVYVDGTLLRRRAPMVRYPIKPGTRKILLEAVSTGERRDFNLRFAEGQHRKLEERFTPRPRR